jgi:hypothetical protein
MKTIIFTPTNSAKQETLPMKKLTIRYIRYALALLANLGFGVRLN